MWVENEWRDGFMCVSTDAYRSQRKSLVHWELKPTGSCEPPSVSVENWIQFSAISRTCPLLLVHLSIPSYEIFVRSYFHIAHESFLCEYPS